LFERIEARRASGERVFLPVDTPAAAAAPDRSRGSVRALGVKGRRAWRAPQWGLAIAATLLLAVGIGREAWRRLQPDSTSQARSDSTGRPTGGDQVVTGTPQDSQHLGSTGVPLPSAITLRGATDSAERLWLALSSDTKRARTLALKQSFMQLHMDFSALEAPRSDGDSLAVGLRDPVFDGATLSAVGRNAILELAEVLARRMEYRVAIVRYTDSPPSDSATDSLMAKAQAIRAALENGGVAADRITLATAPYSVVSVPDRARIEVVVLAPKPAPEIR
jgi:hypothetical protein